MPNAIRAEGYRQAMRARGLQEDIDIVSTSYTSEGGYLGAQQLLARSRRPTAIFAGADVVAMGVLEAIAEAGLAVPRDISVAGYDNTTFAALGPISLTSVDQAGHQIGSNAARLLLERIADRRGQCDSVLLPRVAARCATGVLGATDQFDLRTLVSHVRTHDRPLPHNHGLDLRANGDRVPRRVPRRSTAMVG